jgi:pimeloyl-ACP methyl ester carboxylesterase
VSFPSIKGLVNELLAGRDIGRSATNFIIAIMRRLLITVAFTFAVFTLQAQDQNEANYDESKVPSYVLPDVLKTTANTQVKDKTTWEKQRRPEIIKLFEVNIYGQMPKAFDSIAFFVTNESPTAMGGKAKLKEVVIAVSKNGKTVRINLVLFVPNNVVKPAPAFLLINNRGQDNTDAARATKSEFWPAEMLIDSGYAIAAFHVSDLAPDDKVTYINGVLQLYPEQLIDSTGMKAIGAWAWGASRVMDYFEKDKDIDSKKVAIVGHSRGGKAALWAAAEDRRFAMCVTNCSGNSGAALARRQFGERINRINTVFPHWFNDNYKKYNNNENSLPVDQHMLIALVAPRPLYATNASKDLWADPTGTFLSLKNAEKVYALYGVKSSLPASPPGINQPVLLSPLAYHNREGEHNLTLYDWGNFIKFADYHYKQSK